MTSSTKDRDRGPDIFYSQIPTKPFLLYYGGHLSL
jgi:hypothetical protein